MFVGLQLSSDWKYRRLNPSCVDQMEQAARKYKREKAPEEQPRRGRLQKSRLLLQLQLHFSADICHFGSREKTRGHLKQQHNSAVTQPHVTVCVCVLQIWGHNFCHNFSLCTWGRGLT